jgi:hypothetical protein
MLNYSQIYYVTGITERFTFKMRPLDIISYLQCDTTYDQGNYCIVHSALICFLLTCKNISLSCMNYTVKTYQRRNKQYTNKESHNSKKHGDLVETLAEDIKGETWCYSGSEYVQAICKH